MSTKLFLPVSIVLCAASSFAQVSTSTGEQTTSTTTSTAAVESSPARQRLADGERIVMTSGALAKVAGTHATRIDVDVVLADGTRVSPGGTIYLADGTSSSLRDGQQITGDGKISTAPPEAVAAA